MDEHFDSFQQVYDERFAAKYGYWRPVIQRSVEAFLKCGDLQEGFARVRCPDCKHEIFVAYSCNGRCTCPSVGPVAERMRSNSRDVMTLGYLR